MLYVSDALRSDKRFNKLMAKIQSQKARRSAILRQSAKWVALLFAEAALVQVAAGFGIAVFENPVAMACAAAFGVLFIYYALRESKDYKSIKTGLREAESKLRRYCADFEAGASASSSTGRVGTK